MSNEQLSSLSGMLISEGLVSPVAVTYARQKQLVEKRKLGALLVDLGFLSPKDLARTLAKLRGIEFKQDFQVATDVSGGFNRNLCATNCFLPLHREGEKLRILLGDAEPEVVANLVKKRVGLEAVFWQGDFFAVDEAIQQYFYFQEHSADSLLEAEVKRLAADRDHAYSPAALLELILHLAVRDRATDVHIAPTQDSRTILFRVDGSLRPMFAMPPALDRLTAYIKLQAQMDASEQRLPQDGSFSAKVMNAAYTVRVSTMISQPGERVAMRLLAEKSSLDRFEDLGFLQEDLEALKKVFSKTHGLVLVTGPTGSGKSTTLHAALRMQPLVERNVLTVEDPVEYRIPAACQTEVNRKAGYDFAGAMRHFLRHDPDVVLVGEIRDAETARAALDAASTGHLVMSSLHIGGIFGVVPRLRLLGVESETVAENLTAVINQRLIRKICGHCKTERPASERESRWLGVAHGRMLSFGQGCVHCAGTGYRGRIPVYEILAVTREVGDAIAKDSSREILRDLAKQAGLRPMEELAKRRVLAGETSFDEIEREIDLGTL
jgi:type II secretory ATPase GspE/PulE/Tfp pilus assembly ATPase PilB-like protein